MNQIDIPNYQYYLGCNAKRMVRLTFLEKSSYFSRKYRLIRLFYFQKYISFIGSKKELFKSNRTRNGVSNVYLECKTKRIFAIACLGKK